MKKTFRVGHPGRMQLIYAEDEQEARDSFAERLGWEDEQDYLMAMRRHGRDRGFRLNCEEIAGGKE